MIQHCHNSAAQDAAGYGDRQRRVLDPAACLAARQEISSWPGYAPTPLINLQGMADSAGVEQILYKDEAGRFGLGSFKALGGAFAVSRILIEEIANRTGKQVHTADLLNGIYREITEQVTVSCATDGNHGRSVAWGAQQFGCRCVIYIHATVSEGRQQAIEYYGAQVVRTTGNYDDSVRQAAADAETFGRTVVSDTSYPGYMDIPRFVMQGYTVLADEIVEQMDGLPTHIFLQGGVGGFAAAVIARFWYGFEKHRPRCIVVEPDQAACIYASVRAGRPTAVGGDLDTIMAGLACGEISLLAWEILEQAMDDVLTVPDDAAAHCMRLLADGIGDDPPLVAGESAVAGLAGLLLAMQDPVIADALALNSRSRVLLISTEGDTDPDVYQRIVGRSAAEVIT